MGELPERKQAHPTFDTLYTLTKKLEAGQPVCKRWYTTSSEVYRDKHRCYLMQADRVAALEEEVYRDKHRCYLMQADRVAALEEEGSALSDQVTGEDSESEVEVVGGLNMHLAQAMSHYQWEEQQCFMCGSPGHFAQGCPHCKAFRQWHRDQASSKGAEENGSPSLGTTSSQPEVNVHVIRRVRNPWLEVGGPTAHWLRPETLVELIVEGRNFTALADSGSQVNMITPTLVQQCGFPVLPLEDLVDYPVNLVGLGEMRTSPLGFVIFCVQV